MKCRHCKTPLKIDFLDLGMAHPSNDYLSKRDLNKKIEPLPLRVKTCSKCFLTQTIDFTSSKRLFRDDYAYFSSISSQWLKHSKEFVKKIIKRLKLTKNSFVVEIASNDGYLLKNFINKVPSLGIEPTKSTAKVAKEIGLEVLEEFFDYDLSKKIVESYSKADLIIANNVYAHVPDINNFTKGLENLLKPNGVVSIEFPHLMNLIKYNQFDTVYHEHFSYLSLISVKRIFETFNLKIFDVEEINTHGGSLRVFGCKKDSKIKVNLSVKKIIQKETYFGLKKEKTYKSFQKKADQIKKDFISFLEEKKLQKKKVFGYGAAAKANTLINFSDANEKLLPKVFDASKHKQGKFLPGSKIPILDPENLKHDIPDYLIIFPWNIVKEIKNQLSFLKKHNTEFVTFIPKYKKF